MKMLQHDILNWNSIPDDSDIWKNSGLRTNSKKQRFQKKYKNIKTKIKHLGDIEEGKEPDEDNTGEKFFTIIEEEEHEAATEMSLEIERMQLTTLDDVEEYKATMEMAIARRRRCNAVLVGGRDDPL